MKHTYLYQFTGSVAVWFSARLGPGDVHDYPPLDAPEAVWVERARQDDEYGKRYDALMEVIHEAPRVCLGRRYTLPGSVRPDLAVFEEGITEATREVTHQVWDGPVMTADLAEKILETLRTKTTDDSCDPLNEIAEFLHRSAGVRVIPVWM